MAGDFWQVERTLSAAQLEQQEYGNADKIYNLYTMEQLQALLPHVDLDGLLAASGFAAPDKLMVDDVGLLKASAAYFDDAHLDTLKTVMKLYLLSGFGSALSRDFLDAATKLQQTMYGTDERLPDDQLAAQLVQSYLADYLGQVYVEHYFSAEAKADVEAMTAGEREELRRKLAELDELDELEKQAAEAAAEAEQAEAAKITEIHCDKHDDGCDGE